VKPPAFDYHAPEDLDTALALLGELGEDGKVLAGGQSLVPMMNLRLATPAALVDITRIRELDHLEVDDDTVTVGATVTHEQLRTDRAAAASCPLLRQALDLVAHGVVRNRGTAVGSLTHADPAAELPAVVALLDARVELASSHGTRTVTGLELFLGSMEADVRDDEVATAAVFPVIPARTGTAFHELARRHGDYALAGVATTVTLDDDARISGARAAVIGVADRPVVVDLGAALSGQAHDALDVADAVGHLREQLDPGDDIHATGSYRRHLAGVLCGRAIVEAAARAASSEGAG
jgi:aerobic carbon-monoxide dehydrogenase medium subunit